MKLLIANWKMAPDTPVQAVALAKATAGIARTYKKGVTIVVCVPYVHIGHLAKATKTLLIGGQTVAATTTIASTGLISASMLRAVGCSYCIVGHSESRAQGETNETVQQQLHALLDKKIIPILCVGEKTRDTQGWYLSIIKDQIESALENVPKSTLKRLVIAYEPIWAIGEAADREATPGESLEMIIFIRKIIADLYDEKIAASITILYGGSVNETNGHTFIREGGADGLLVGRVSLEPKRFAKIADSLSKIEQ
ncbi:MAG: triose-phosphate isomerase [Candidatus Pacebacteria bacterium]|nr:triose-phosphate isomerase [Candidatus Paceibacterota bacterium]MBP9700932.1 triose-phosphate isomerase [Candidatus Paceibacterota bacterium]